MLSSGAVKLAGFTKVQLSSEFQTLQACRAFPNEGAHLTTVEGRSVVHQLWNGLRNRCDCRCINQSPVFCPLSLS